MSFLLHRTLMAVPTFNKSCGFVVVVVLFTTADRCPYLPDVINASRSSHLAVIESLTTFTCVEGHEFTSEQTKFTVKCLDILQWNASVPAFCQRKPNFDFFASPNS